MRIELSREKMEMARKMARKILIEHGDHMAGWLTCESLKELELFLNTIEDFIEKEEKRELSALDKFLETIPKTERGEYLSDHYPFEWQQVLGAHFRSSFLITLMSVTEDSLSRICTQVSTMLDSSISNKDLKGSILEAAKKYLQAIGKYEAPPEHHWATVIDLYKVRNVMVHNGGMLEGAPNEKRIRAFMDKAPGISAPQSAFLKFEKEFCFYALEQVKELFCVLDAEQEKLRLRIKETIKT